MWIFFLIQNLLNPCFGTDYFPRSAMSPLEVGTAHPQELSSQNCKACHQQEFKDWSGSRHSEAYTNQNFQEGYFRETQDRCLHCHAPLKEQFLEIKKRPQLELAREGVNCTVCHVREGVIQSSSGTGSVYHAYKKNDFLKDPKFCASCHEFNINSHINGVTALTPENAQSTYSEWLEYKNRGGVKTCQNCHMPEGKHLFHGAHKNRASPLKVLITKGKRETIFTLQNLEVGHNFPTGDVFRRVSFEVKKSGMKDFETIQNFERHYTMVQGFRLQSNSTIKPMGQVQIKVKIKPPFDYQIRYHFMKDTEKTHTLTQPKDQERLLHSGRVLP